MQEKLIARLTAAATVVLISFALIAPARTAEPNAKTAPALELVTLGSGGPGALGRASSSHVVLIDGEPRILLDAGPGAFARLGEAKLSLAHLDIVLLTHLHVDHVGELPGLIKARAVSQQKPIHFRVFGPEGSGLALQPQSVASRLKVKLTPSVARDRRFTGQSLVEQLSI